MSQPLGVAIVGCGDIAAAYGASIRAKPSIALRGATDRNPPRVERFVADWGGVGYASIDDLLADPDVDAVVNLTRQNGHYEVTRRCLEAGKHVYSEKPLGLTHAACAELTEIADRHDVRLACAPITYLGEAQQAAWQLVDSGALGQVRLVYAEANWGQIESWHPRPQEFYQVGATFDVGVYPLTLITAFFGPAVRVRASGGVLRADRVTTTGEPFTITTPDFVTAFIELESGVVARLTCSFYVDMASRQKGLEIHGDSGAVLLDSWFHFNSPIALVPRGGEPEPLTVGGSPPDGADYGRGLDDLAAAIRDDRPHLASAAHAAHVVEVAEAIHQSVRDGGAVTITSTFTPPAMSRSHSLIGRS
jgi:predicted dehydrogenase